VQSIESQPILGLLISCMAYSSILKMETACSSKIFDFQQPYIPEHRTLHSKSQSQSYITTDGQPASLSWNKAPIWGLRPDLDYYLTVAGLLVWGALSDERTGLPFAIAAGPCQRSLSRV
jgi:hypothetical protein